MLSQSIQTLRITMAEEFSEGAMMSSAMQWKLVEILLRWEAQAKELERICPPLPGQVPSGFRPKIVGGTDFTKNPETKEALECS